MTTRQGIYLRKSYINFFPDPIMEISKMYYPEIQSNKLAFTIPHHYLKLFKNNSFAICEQNQADCYSVCVGLIKVNVSKKVIVPKTFDRGVINN